MGSWGVKALESDNGLDLIFLLKSDYLPKHKKLTLGGLIGFLKEEGFLGETVSEIDFLYDNTAIALAELYSEWQETGKLNYDDEDSNVWSAITNFSASATARKDLLRRLRSIKNQVPDEDGEREIVELWKESNNWESWDKHLDSLIKLLQQDRRGAGAAGRLAANRIVRHHMAWEYETFGPDGQCKLFGVNIFDYDWQTTGKRVKVKDPIYHQDHTFEVWQVEIDGQIHRFAAGEFSNCIWGFYLEKN